MQLLNPLQDSITIMQVYHAQHYTTLITDNNKYYYYDGISLAVPPTVQSLHTHLRTWYGTGRIPNSFRTETPNYNVPKSPEPDGRLDLCNAHAHDIVVGYIPR
jgi:hypothetical protein